MAQHSAWYTASILEILTVVDQIFLLHAFILHTSFIVITIIVIKYSRNTFVMSVSPPD